MKHLGDITKIKDAPVVDCVIGGSPCQDLSVAGKRKGLAGERSGLFMEQIRIIKEMRQKDEASGRTGVHIRPRYMVWENVPGTFSSNRGEDFRAVLEEVCRVVDPDVSIPRPAGGKWSCAGCIMADGYSVAWRVHDAQFWGKTIRDSHTGNVIQVGTPQRRRRVALVADFGGRSAPEILFERVGLQGDTQQGDEERKGSAETSVRCAEPAISFQEANCGMSTGRCGVLEKKCYGISAYESNCMKSDNPNSGIYEADTARTIDNNGGNPSCNQGGTVIVENVFTLNGKDAAQTIDAHYYLGAGSRGGQEREMVFDARENGNGKTSPTITGDHSNRVTDYTALCIGNGQADQLDMHEKAGALNCMHDQQAIFFQETGHVWYNQSDTGATIRTPKGNRSGIANLCCDDFKYKFVRRFTPLECERLQGYPDHWTDIRDWVDSKGKKRKTSDANRYKALGNSIALPFWRWLTKQISSQYAYTPTMASLFDGIGGFPLLWEEVNGKGTAIWASEIEEFPIAVTKYHFGED